MVNPIQITQPQAYSGGADFSPLAKLYDVYKASQERAMQEQALGRLGDDPIANARTLTQSGVLPLAQLGIGLQDKEIVRRREDLANQQAQENWEAQQKLREQETARAADYLKIQQSQEQRAGRKEYADTPEGRKASIIAAGMNPDDPNVRAHIAAGAELPTPLALEKAAREKYKFEQEQKYDTREKRLKAAEEGGLDKTNPTIMQWIALGPNEPPDIAKGKLGIGVPLFTQNTETGEVVAHQLRNDIPFVTPAGHRLLGPGEIAQTKAAGTQLAKDQRTLGAVELNADFLLKHIDETVGHPGKHAALGFGSYFPTSRGSEAAGFESRQEQLQGEAFSAAYETLRGAAGISEGEGKAATAALNRAKLATSVKEFDAAMFDFRARVEKMRELARKRASGAAPAMNPASSTAAAPAATAPAPTKTYKNVPFTFTP